MAEMKVRFFYTVTAVVFGADETLLNIELVNGFKFVKRNLPQFIIQSADYNKAIDTKHTVNAPGKDIVMLDYIITHCTKTQAERLGSFFCGQGLELKTQMRFRFSDCLRIYLPKKKSPLLAEGQEGV